MKAQSELMGDHERQAEMTCPRQCGATIWVNGQNYMIGTAYVNDSTAVAQNCNNDGATSISHCPFATNIKVAVREAVRQYGDHYMDVAAEDIANEVFNRPAAR